MATISLPIAGHFEEQALRFLTAGHSDHDHPAADDIAAMADVLTSVLRHAGSSRDYDEAVRTAIGARELEPRLSQALRQKLGPQDSPVLVVHRALAPLGHQGPATAQPLMATRLSKQSICDAAYAAAMALAEVGAYKIANKIGMWWLDNC